MNCKDCVNYYPKEKKPVTTVTQWWSDLNGSVTYGTYSFSGLPDINRVIRETLEDGALAVKIECTKTINDIELGLGKYTGVFIWNKNIGLINQRGYVHDWCCKYYTYAYSYPIYGFNDADIVTAIQEYAKKQETEPVNITDFATIKDLQVLTARLDKIEKELSTHCHRIDNNLCLKR